MIHELGHAIVTFNCDDRPHSVVEEQLVNNFVYAYWKHYGELRKMEELREIVDSTISKYSDSDLKNVGYIEYAMENWGAEDFLHSIITVGFSLVVFRQRYLPHMI